MLARLEKREKFVSLALLNAFAFVNNLHVKHLLFRVIACQYVDRASMGELECIFCQVNQYLLQADLITNYSLW